MKKAFAIMIAAAIILVSSPMAQAQENSQARALLSDFVKSYRAKVGTIESRVFGISIPGEGGGEWHVEVTPGPPARPTYFYIMSLETLRQVHAGEMNVLTAMGRARMSDPAPADIRFMDGFEPSPDFLADVLPATFHFFTLGSPEFVPYGEDKSRIVHGAHMLVFYYQKGLRTAWAQIDKGMVVNEDPKDQVNPFPTLVIGLKGRIHGRLDGRPFVIDGPKAMLIPAGASHTFWNEDDEPAQAIIIMFGDGA